MPYQPLNLSYLQLLSGPSYNGWQMNTNAPNAQDALANIEAARYNRARERGAEAQRALYERQLSLQEMAYRENARATRAREEQVRAKERNELFQKFGEAVGAHRYDLARSYGEEIGRRGYGQVQWEVPPEEAQAKAAPAPSPLSQALGSELGVPINTQEKTGSTPVAVTPPPATGGGPPTTTAQSEPGPPLVGETDALDNAILKAFTVQQDPALNPRLSWLLSLSGPQSAQSESSQSLVALQAAADDARKRGDKKRLNWLLQHEGLKQPPELRAPSVETPTQANLPALPTGIGAPPAPPVSSAAPWKATIPVAASAQGAPRRPSFRVVDQNGQIIMQDSEEQVAQWQGATIARAFAGLAAAADTPQKQRALKMGIEQAAGMAGAEGTEKAIEAGFDTYNKEMGRETSLANARISASGRRPEEKLLTPYEVARVRANDIVTSGKTQALQEQRQQLQSALRDLMSGDEIAKSRALKILIRTTEDRISNQDYAIVAQSNGLAGVASQFKNFVMGSAPISSQVVAEAQAEIARALTATNQRLQTLAQQVHDMTVQTTGRRSGTPEEWDLEGSMQALRVYDEWKNSGNFSAGGMPASPGASQTKSTGRSPSVLDF